MIDRRVLEILVCPITGGELVLSDDKQELFSPKANCAYPIRDRIPIMLEDEARPLTQEEKEAIKSDIHS